MEKPCLNEAIEIVDGAREIRLCISHVMIIADFVVIANRGKKALVPNLCKKCDILDSEEPS